MRQKPRVETLDWLRGLMALSIMFFHLTTALIAPQNASSILGRLGIYGVAVFFILSGLSIGIVYNTYITSIRNTFFFYIRRIFRIWPLLWIVCFLTILPILIETGHYSWKYFVLNITTLFGFYSPSDYIAVGSWSIGNEMVYYALTPFIILLYNYSKLAGNLFFLVTTVLGMYFAFFLLDPALPLSANAQWTLYVHPFNNFFLYVLGIALYYNFKDFHVNKAIVLSALLISVAAFCFLPYRGDEIAIVTGVGRVVFALLSGIIVFCFYKMEITLPEWISDSFETFGIATYGVYLLHPVVFSYLKGLFGAISLSSPPLLYLSTVAITIPLAVLSFRYFESAFTSIGKNLTNKLKVIR